MTQEQAFFYELYFWLAISFGLYLAFAILWSVVVEVSIRKDLREKNIDSFEQLASIAIPLTYVALFWPLSVAKTLIYVIRKKIERRRIDKKLKKTLKEMAKEQTKPLGASFGEPSVDEVELKNKVSPMKESDIVTRKQLNNLVSNGGFKATQSWDGEDPNHAIDAMLYAQWNPNNRTLFYKDIPIVEQLEKIHATQDMNALQELIDELKKVGG